MAITAPFCESTSISYLALFLPPLFIQRREYLLVLIIFSAALFYRITPGIPLTMILIPLYVFSVILNEKVLKLNLKINIVALVLSIGVIVYLVLSCHNSITGSYDALAKNIIYVIFIYFSIYDKSCNWVLLSKIFLYTSLVGLVILASHLIVNPAISLEGRRTLSMLHNANVTARGLAIMTVITFVCNNVSFRGVLGYIKIIAVLLGLISIFLTGSRMSLFATLLTMAICFYCSFKNKKTFFRYAVICIALLLMFLPVMANVDIDYGRFEEGFTEKGITENVRVASSLILWNEAIVKHPLTGVGLGNDNSEYILEYVPDADNMYVDILTQLGAIGLVFILLLIGYTLKRLFSNMKKHHERFSFLMFPIALIILQIPLSFTESVFDELVIWYAIAISNISINTLKNEGFSIYSSRKL